MHPLVSAEVGDLNLLRALNRGMIPVHYLEEDYHKSLQSYVRDYLKEEVFDEGLTRNIPDFSRFFGAPLKAFMEEYHPKKAFVVCNERMPRVHESIHLLPWRDFLIMLWNGSGIS